MEEEKKNKLKGIFGTVLFHALLLLLLSLPFMSLTYQDPPPKKGGGSIAINFSAQKTTEINTKPIKEEIIKSPEKIITQDNTEALKVNKAEDKEKVAEEKETLTKEEAIFDFDEDGVLNDKERKAYEALQRVNAGLNKVTVTFEGRNHDADLGDNGNGENNGEYQLGNRKPTFLPETIYNSKAEGIVVVHIIVDQFGNVVSASPGKKGSTTQNKQLLAGAKNAALETKYPPKADAPNQNGKLIYTFQKK